MGANIVSAVWSDRKFAMLGERKFGGVDGRLAWFYVCTGPHTGQAKCGLYRMEIEQMAYDLQCGVEGAREALLAMEASSLIAYSEVQGLLFINRYLAHNKPNSAKNVKGWAAHAATCPAGRVRNAWLKHLKAYCASRGQSFVDTYTRCFAPMVTDMTAVEKLPPEDMPEPAAPKPKVVDRPRKKREPKPVSGRALTVAADLRSQVQQRVERAIPKAKIHEWAVHVDRIVQSDGRSWEQVDAVVRGLPKDEFWCKVILSGQSLRKNFDKVYTSVMRAAKDDAGDPYEKFRNGGSHG